MKFPQFRKYKNNLSYFKITDNNTFIEYKVEGNKVNKYKVLAKILPDRNFISDMLIASDYWDIISENDFELFVNNCS